VAKRGRGCLKKERGGKGEKRGEKEKEREAYSIPPVRKRGERLIEGEGGGERRGGLD